MTTTATVPAAHKAAIDKVRHARSQLLLTQPWFGVIALSLVLTPDDECQTFWTDGKRLGFLPSHVASLQLPNLKSEIAHECMHIVLHHLDRRGNRKHPLWNAAGDYAANLILKDARFVLTKDWLLDDKYRGMTSEQIYDDLLKNQPPPGSKGSCGCGGMREPKDANGKKALAQHVDYLINSATMTAGIGNVPGALQSKIAIGKPAMSCKDHIRHFAEEVYANDYSWQRPNSRYIGSGIYLPTLRSTEKKAFAVVMDTSGSVSNSILGDFWSMTCEVLDQPDHPNVILIQCDAAVQEVTIYDRDNKPLGPVEFKVKGRGGTRYSPPFKWLADNGHDVGGLIYFGDMENCDWPAEPDYPTLWVKRGSGDQWKPPFGTLVDFTN